MGTPLTRRGLIAGTAAASAAVLAGCKTNGDHHHHDAAPATPSIELADNATILFQGDSITDAGRNKQITNEPNVAAALGNGYASLISYHLLSKYPAKNLQIYNRGISGNKVPDLDARWDRDCIDFEPDILSIMIGVNDYWHTVAFGNKYKGTVESYKTGFSALLKRTKDALPDVQLVLCQPFVVRDAERTTRADWFPEFSDRQAVAQEAAQAYDAVWVPFQTMFDDAVAAGTENKHWSGDAIHVNPNGAALMAMRWLSETGLG